MIRPRQDVVNVTSAIQYFTSIVFVQERRKTGDEGRVPLSE